MQKYITKSEQQSVVYFMAVGESLLHGKSLGWKPLVGFRSLLSPRYHSRISVVKNLCIYWYSQWNDNHTHARAFSDFMFLPSLLHLLGVNRWSRVSCGWRLHPFAFTCFLQSVWCKVLKFSLLRWRWRWRQGLPSSSSGWYTVCWGVRWRVKAKMENSLSAHARIYA